MANPNELFCFGKVGYKARNCIVSQKDSLHKAVNKGTTRDRISLETFDRK